MPKFQIRWRYAALSQNVIWCSYMSRILVLTPSPLVLLNNLSYSSVRSPWNHLMTLRGQKTLVDQGLADRAGWSGVLPRCFSPPNFFGKSCSPCANPKSPLPNSSVFMKFSAIFVPTCLLKCWGLKENPVDGYWVSITYMYTDWITDQLVNFSMGLQRIIQ